MPSSRQFSRAAKPTKDQHSENYKADCTRYLQWLPNTTHQVNYTYMCHSSLFTTCEGKESALSNITPHYLPLSIDTTYTKYYTIHYPTWESGPHVGRWASLRLTMLVVRRTTNKETRYSTPGYSIPSTPSILGTRRDGHVGAHHQPSTMS